MPINNPTLFTGMVDLGGTASTVLSLDSNAQLQSDNTAATSYLNTMVGDSGSGGTKGLVPAPAAGDAAAGKFLKADGTFAVPSGSGGMSIGGTVTSGTTGSILFVGSGPVLAQDNANLFFDDTNNRLGVGVNSGLTAKLQLNTGSASEIGQIIKGTTSQSGDYLQVLDTSSNTAFKINSSGNVTFAGLAQTLSADTNFISTGSVTNTVTGGAINQLYNYNASGTFNYTTSAASNQIRGYVYNTLIKNDPALTGAIGKGIAFYNTFTAKGDTNATTMSNYIGFGDAPVFDILNSGTLAITDYFGFTSDIRINTGVTISNRYGMSIGDTIGTASGNVTLNVGVKIADLAHGTTKIGFYQLGTNAHNRLVGDTSLGQDATPAAKLDILNTTAANPVIKITGASSQSGNYLTINDNSANTLATIGTLGQYRNLNSSLTSTANYVGYTSLVSGQTLTLTTAATSQFVAFTTNGTVAYDSSVTSGEYNLASSITKLTNSGTSSPTLQRIAAVKNTTQIAGTGSGNTITCTDARGFLDSPSHGFNQTGNTAITNLTSLESGPALYQPATTTTTVTTRNGVLIHDYIVGTGTPSLTNNYGIVVEDFANTATTKIAFYNKGTNAHNRLVGLTSFGQDATPVAQVDVLNTTAANAVLKLKGASSQSGNYITVVDSSNAAKFTVTSAGDVSGNNLSGTNTGDQTITLTGDVTGSGTGSFAATAAFATRVVKSADESVTNSAAFQDDDELKFSVAANSSYSFTMVLLVTAGSGAPDFKFQFTGPASTTFFVGATQDAAPGDILTAFSSSSGNYPQSTANSCIYMSGSVITGASSGTVTLQWAQNAATIGVSTTVKKGSFLQAFKV